MDGVTQRHGPFANFECDRCGACCQALIVEAKEYDVRREPRLLEFLKCSREQLRDGYGSIVLYDIETNACPFLDSETHACGIYPTRPYECVMVEPGDAKCQQARKIRGLPLLRDRNGNEPSRALMRHSMNEYDLDESDVLPDGWICNSPNAKNDSQTDLCVTDETQRSEG